MLLRLRWGLAGVLVAWTVIRALGLERGWPLVPLLAFTPYVALLALVVAVLAAWRRWWAGAAVTGACAAILIALLAPRAIPDRAPDGRARRAAARARGQRRGQRSRSRRMSSTPSAAWMWTSSASSSSRRGWPPRTTRQGRARCSATANCSRARGSAAPGSTRASPAPTHASTRHRVRSGRGGGADARCGAGRAARGPRASSDRRRGHRALAARHARAAGREQGSLRLLAGDFNATLDHADLRDLLDRGYRDAAEQAGVGLRPTWPAGKDLLPALVTIDHVLADRRVRVISARSVAIPGSDHRGVLTELLLPRR